MGFFDFLKKKAKAVSKHSPVGVGDFVDVPDAGDVVGVDVPTVPTVPTNASGVAAEAGIDVPGTHDIPGADAARDAKDAAEAGQDLAHAASDDPDKNA
jgi:hypothetical protein